MGSIVEQMDLALQYTRQAENAIDPIQSKRYQDLANRLRANYLAEFNDIRKTEQFANLSQIDKEQYLEYLDGLAHVLDHVKEEYATVAIDIMNDIEELKAKMNDSYNQEFRMTNEETIGKTR